MIFIEDREGVFDASIDKVWKLVQAPTKEESKIHPSAKSVVTEMLDDNYNYENLHYEEDFYC